MSHEIPKPGQCKSCLSAEVPHNLNLFSTSNCSSCQSNQFGRFLYVFPLRRLLTNNIRNWSILKKNENAKQKIIYSRPTKIRDRDKKDSTLWLGNNKGWTVGYEPRSDRQSIGRRCCWGDRPIRLAINHKSKLLLHRSIHP